MTPDERLAADRQTVLTLFSSPAAWGKHSRADRDVRYLVVPYRAALLAVAGFPILDAMWTIEDDDHAFRSLGGADEQTRTQRVVAALVAERLIEHRDNGHLVMEINGDG